MRFKDLDIKICDGCGKIVDCFYHTCYLGFFEVCGECYDHYEAEREKTHESQEVALNRQRLKFRKIKEILLTPLKVSVKEAFEYKGNL